MFGIKKQLNRIEAKLDDISAKLNDLIKESNDLRKENNNLRKDAEKKEVSFNEIVDEWLNGAKGDGI